MVAEADWRHRLRVDPVPALASCANPAIAYLARRDLLDERVGPPGEIQRQPEAGSIARRQQANGSWKYPGGGRPGLRASEDYDQIETYRSLGILVEKYAFTREHPAVERAARFLFARQTKEGDFRGIYGSQYTPNYSAGIMELLIKAGFARDRRIEAGFRWLLSIRQDDGGWAIPLRTRRAIYREAVLSPRPLPPDRTKPFSHLVTGVVLRAFAAHPRYRRRTEAVAAGEILAARLFKRDAYPDRRGLEYWTGVAFPFWFTDVVSSLDSLSLLGIPKSHPGISRGLEWIGKHQRRDGTFAFRLLKTRDKDLQQWVDLAACRALRRLA